ncbi:hypothetical protein Lal_00032459 [Lupinus albus]|uniref:Uncharacterized protein n=1 Tax=Lupinus albus TaxID=3870 RepID=A0A6A4R7A4_LUPAL|nr:hypothetical protein Lalb_Chr01g0018511 [Lupinus albus]KAF1897702.1 hypothetical protein Lal_00032459 [Lupinus albus]
MGYYAVALIMIAFTVLEGCTNNLVLALDESGIIHVGGEVLCQDCSHGWNEWVYGGKPIKGFVTILNLIYY